MRRSTRKGVAILTLCSLLLTDLTGQTAAGDLFFLAPLQRKPPLDCKDHSAEHLAKEIDWLQAHIDTYGTIVPKHPDVWGESRLTRHRHQIEIQMAAELKTFRETLNASISRSDQAFLSAAFTISAATGPNAQQPSADAASSVMNLVNVPDDAMRRSEIGGLPTPTAVTSIGAHSKIEGLSLEPTIAIQQKFRYLQLLNELRRINEGDDTADAPGYALNLVRIPVSILPGKKTREGYGAEITVTAQSHLTPELLPNTFRNLVINDVVDLLALPARHVLDHPEDIRWLRENLHKYNVDVLDTPPAVDTDGICVLTPHARTSEELTTPKPGPEELPVPLIDQGILQDASRQFPSIGEHVIKEILKAQHSEDASLQTDTRLTQEGFRALQRFESLDVSETAVRALAGGVVINRTTHAQLAFPPSQLSDILGTYRTLGKVAVELDRALGDPVNRNYPHVLDVEAFLRTELAAAYQFLSQPEAEILWHTYCTPELVSAIRARRRNLPVEVHQDGKVNIEQHACAIHQLRNNFFQQIKASFPRVAKSITASLAWSIIVDSALLNARLIEDMRTIGVERNCVELQHLPVWLDFYSPNPSPEARHLFAEYVRCRWPVQVFALDPATDDQNIADAFSMRREMQLAAAVALSQGTISPSAAFRFARRLEMDIKTIALNRTAVAFAHGLDTFGWRFYPRVQTPPTVGNAQAFVETLFGGPSEDALLNRRKLEPGIREVTAIVLMPSFVSHVTFDSRANWFKLTNPKHRELTMHDAMKISRSWQAVRTATPALCKAECYRAEDIAWLSKSVTQLERQLPLQTMLVQIPYENTLGGFELFSSGITDLAPSLAGWYGAPGITVTDPVVECKAVLPLPGVDLPEALICPENCLGTTLFLVGNQFSVHDTQVIAGGRCVPFRLLSRQIMQVTIPPNVTRLLDERQRLVVDVHVATPYGASNHLLIPAVPPTPPVAPAKRPPGFYWAAASAKLTATLAPSGNPKPPFFELTYVPDLPKSLAIDNLDRFPTPAAAQLQVLVFSVSDTGEKLLGQTMEYPTTRSDNQKSLVVIEARKFGCEVETIVEKRLAALDNPKQIQLVGFLHIDGWPPVKIVEPIVIELTRLPFVVPPQGKGQMLPHDNTQPPPPAAGATETLPNVPPEFQLLSAAK